MGRTLKFYLAAILVLGSAAFLALLFATPDARETADGLLVGWAVTSAMTGIYLIIFCTPIQWVAYWLKRPWLAYLGSALLLPVIFLVDNVEDVTDMEFTMAYIQLKLQQSWGLYLVVFIITILFTLAYQRWYRKKT